MSRAQKPWINPATRRTAAAPAQTMSATQAAALVQSNMWLDYGLSTGQPDVFDQALAARIHEVTNVKLRNCLSLRPRAVLEADPHAEHIISLNLHMSGYDRKKGDSGNCFYLPVNLGEIPDYYRRFMPPSDIVILQTCPIDANGYFNFSVSNVWHQAIIERAKTVIVETCATLPYAMGDHAGIHISEVDYIIEGGCTPTPCLPAAAPCDVDRKVAHLIAAEIQDGACLQIGIGGMPNAVCTLLGESGARDLGIHTEMLTDGIIDLYKAGIVNNARKQLNPGKLVYTFALGTASLYSTLDRNPDMLSCPVDYTNLPHIIMQNDNVVAINNTTQIDLQGQAASESDGHRHISGTGGQAQFVRAAYASQGGKSFICLSSTYEKHGQRRSRIVLDLTPGNVVTTTRSDMMYVVTEYGMANLKGKSVPERAQALINLAHPDFREDMERQAYNTKIIPRGFTF
jgi:acyl-CoA hydrolase